MVGRIATTCIQYYGGQSQKVALARTTTGEIAAKWKCKAGGCVGIQEIGGKEREEGCWEMGSPGAHILRRERRRRKSERSWDPRDAHLPYGSPESKSCCPTGVRPTVPVRAHPGSCTLPPQMLPRVSSTPPPPIIAAADAVLEDPDVHEGAQMGDSWEGKGGRMCDCEVSGE